MDNKKQVYVIDTNVLIDYTDIIPSPDKGFRPLDEPVVDLSEAHLVIPSIVIRELSSFKGENSEREHASRKVLNRLDILTKTCNERLVDAYKHGISVTVGEQIITVLPVHKDFQKCLPFNPSDDDNDGQIILAALTMQFHLAGLKTDGTAAPNDLSLLPSSQVTLLTNKNRLRIRARERGIRAMCYHYKLRDPYTGRRDITVPRELFLEFCKSKSIPVERFTELMPSEPPLAANEFIIMALADPQDYPSDFVPQYYRNIARYDAENGKLVHLKYAHDFPVSLKNAGQAIYAEALMNPEFAAVICMGSPGSGKTFMATIYGYKACQNGDFIGVTVVPCENRSSLGALPGSLDEKMDPDVQPLKNALRNYLLHEDSDFRKELKNTKKYGPSCQNGSKTSNGSGTKNGKSESTQEQKNGKSDAKNGDKPQNDANNAPRERSLKVKLKDAVDAIWEDLFSSIPIEHAGGRDFAYELAIYDEFQDQNAKQADTLIKRLGKEGKIILTGDIYQTHSAYLDEYNNGLTYASNLVYDNPMVAQVCFLEDEVIRHPLVRLIAERQKARITARSTSERLDEVPIQ
ncbi:PhoH family protein [Candidatus Saccharibacteria bacterium]|nr:PhoH family protein [Candidatus Saccharibacteria bacterium]